MKFNLHSKLCKALAVAVGMLAGAWAVGAAWDTYKVMKMTEQMKTVCVGRMLIDLPREANVEVFNQWIDGFDIDAFAETPEAFGKRVAAREAELRAKPDRMGGTNNMEEVREVATGSGLVGKIFVHSRNVTEGTEGYSRETLRRYRYEDVVVEAHVHGHGISIDVTAKDYDPDLVEDLPRLVSQLVANPDNHIPTESGFCLDRAYVRDPLTAKQGERMDLFAWLPSHPDIEIHFDTIIGIKHDGHGLLERNAAAHARAPFAINERFTNLRAAPRTIGGFTGDELVERVLEENFVIINGFEWETIGTEDDVFKPDLNLKMATGHSREGMVWPSLAEPAALALWDRIASSIRLRPAAQPLARPDPATAGPVPIGAQALAGQPCPRSGWWECDEGGPGVRVARGRRRYFTHGRRLPQALLLPCQTWWEKLRQVQPSYENTRPTTWKLVGL